MASVLAWLRQSTQPSQAPSLAANLRAQWTGRHEAQDTGVGTCCSDHAWCYCGQSSYELKLFGSKRLATISTTSSRLGSADVQIGARESSEKCALRIDVGGHILNREKTQSSFVLTVRGRPRRSPGILPRRCAAQAARHPCPSCGSSARARRRTTVKTLEPSVCDQNRTPSTH